MTLELIVAVVVGFAVPIGAVGFFVYKTRHVRRDAEKALRSIYS